MPKEDARARLESTLARLAGVYAEGTLAEYRGQFTRFIVFCDARQRRALPAAPSTVCAYLEELVRRGRRPSLVVHALDSIAALHRFNQLSDPTKDVEVRLAVRRMRRALGRHQRQALGLGWAWVTRMLAVTDPDLRGLRDRALLRLAYDTLGRSSELSSLCIEDLRARATARGASGAAALVHLRRSKTDPEAAGCWLPIRAATYAALRRWLKAADLHEGALLRGVDRAGRPTKSLSPDAIAVRYRELARRAGLGAAAVRQVSGHSLRVGAAQDLLLAGASLEELKRRGRWTKSSTVMRYVERAGELRERH